MNVQELLDKTLKTIESSPLPSIHQFLDPMLKILEVKTIKAVDFSKVIDFSSKEDFDKQVEEKGEFLVEKSSGDILLFYIHTFGQYYDRYDSYPKYHLIRSCERMQTPHRYRSTTNTTGLFEGTDGNQTVSKPLALCKTCFKGLYTGGTHGSFNLADFCEQQKGNGGSYDPFDEDEDVAF